MDREIKRLLKLSNIPNFKLSEEENKRLDDWKKAQEPVKVIRPKRTYKKKTTNEVKDIEKETGEMEIEMPDFTVNSVFIKETES